MGPESQERPADVDAAGHCEECTDCAKADGRVEDVKQCVISLTFRRIAPAAERELQGAAGAAEGPAGGGLGSRGYVTKAWTRLEQGNRCSMLECGSYFGDNADRTYCQIS